MRAVLLLAVAIAAVAPLAIAQPTLSFPAGALATEAKLLGRVDPKTRNWIRQEAERQVAAGTASEATARQAAARHGAVGGMDSANIEEITFLVLMMATRAAHEDMKAIADRVKQINEQKEKARQVQGPATAARSAEPRPANAVPRASLPPTPVAVAPKPLPRAGFDSNLDRERPDPESLNRMGDLESMRLQEAMNKQSKLEATLSNLMAKMSGTSKNAIRNMK